MTGTSSKVKQNCHDTDIIITKILMIMINAMIMKTIKIMVIIILKILSYSKI